MKSQIQKNRLSLSLLLLLGLAEIGQTANILVMLPMPLLSHTRNFQPIFTALAARGHNVTMVSPFPQKTPVANLTDIVVPNFMHKLMAIHTQQNKNILDMDNIIGHLFGILWAGLRGIPLVFEYDEVKRFIDDTDSKFDLVITEAWFIQEPLVAFGHKFQAPVINIQPAFLFPVTQYMTGNHLPVSTTPIMFYPFSDHMTFKERIINFFVYYVSLGLTMFYYLPGQDALMREHFKYPGSEQLPPLQDLLRDTALTLSDYNPAIGYPAPLHRNVIPFGGINVKKAEKLPMDIQKFMDTAKDGVVYLSFGSYMNVSLLPQETQNSLFTSLGGLKQKVLMKLEDPEILKKYPEVTNIKVQKWFPQASILAHPNCKLFITHGGLHGVMEGVYNAVPLLVIPLMADQKFNGKFVATSGMGIALNREEITKETLTQTMATLLYDPTYRNKMQERSAIFKDTPIDLLENAVYWIEYVIRHKGAKHLRPASLDLYWYQYMMLDVILFYSLVLFLIYFIIKTILKFFFSIICKICGKSTSCKKDTKKSKKE